MQGAFIQTGLNSSRLADAQIPGIGPKLKERLAAHAVLTAAPSKPKFDSICGWAGRRKNKGYSELEE